MTMDFLDDGYWARDARADALEESGITEDDLLTYEIQLKREGTLPTEVQRRLLEHVADRLVAV
jgi:hypothetical protein